MEEGTFLLPGESAGQVAELEPEQPRPRRGRTNGSKTPEPPRWVKVPVERLDDTGQAVDDEGDRELERSLRKNPSK